eukprot:CAMPEP_0196810880 /NCGR_PEP_ID=MMETSP1362-20130617/15007_1 /TAXON_ID=163516 /ORGANISM="Leptocylindrus danicus, Strain CCMP1856" /LENGTH=314 /DNA_ID=CAMNT_0042186061 /DNA_START=33 /DNA_END=977 /DNA_ORIENTATION=-
MTKIANTIILLLASAVSCSAFTPAAFTRSAAAQRAEQQSEIYSVADVSGEDMNFDGIELEKVLGAKRLSNIRRKLKRERNQALRATADDSTETAATSGATEAEASKPLGIIIAGAPASGKGTQCEMIVNNYKVTHLSTGDMLRAAVAAGTPVGLSAKEYMDAGKLVPDDVIIGIVKDRLEEADCKENGWLLDGFPRTQAQAKALADAGVSADCFIFLNVPDEVLIERVVGRRTDPETGKIYHMTFSPPEDEAVLARLEQRSDDTEEKVKVRLEQFHANVAAVKGSYEDISVEIDGTQKPAEVASAISSALKERV